MAGHKSTQSTRRATLQAVSILHKNAPGDVTVLTALVRDIKLAYGRDIRIGIHPETHCKDLFENNPYVVPYTQLGKHRPVNCGYGAGITRQREEPVHFLSYFHRDFTKQTGLPVTVRYPWPDIHLSPTEKLKPNYLPDRYWVILSGGKYDMTVKIWSTAYFQEVVTTLKSAFGIQCVQIGSNTGGYHPDLAGTLDIRGRTNLRQMLQVIHHSDGVICGVTAAMHMAAALHKPCVVIAGSREAWWWEAYVRENPGLPKAELLQVPHQFLHTHSLIDCRDFYGCWRNKVRPLTAPTLPAKVRADKSLCLCPVKVAGQDLAECMSLIRPEHVVNAVMTYYKDCTLPPIGALPPMAELVPRLQAALPTAAAPAEVVTRNKTPEPEPVIITPPPPAVILPSDMPFDADYDHEHVGGKITVHVLLYGNYPEMHRNCLDSLQYTLPKGRYELRVGSASLCNETLDYLKELQATGVLTWHYCRPDNPGKYKIMRQMFHDSDHPITTKWLLWLDDDTVCNKDPLWFRQLCRRIAETYDRQVRLVGPAATRRIEPAYRTWLLNAAWYRGRQFRNGHGHMVPNGDVCHFATGSFWALATEMIAKAGIPDPRLEHNGGDFTIGEQVWQAGFTLASFSTSRQSINWSSVKRRGRSDNFPWGGKDIQRNPPK